MKFSAWTAALHRRYSMLVIGSRHWERRAVTTTALAVVSTGNRMPRSAATIRAIPAPVTSSSDQVLARRSLSWLTLRQSWL